MFHHVLPLAIPGILTGSIIGIAQALGETAPLLLIGMNAFVASVPATPFDQSNALPVQIYLWQGNELRNFFEGRTSAAIVVLLALMLSLNASRPGRASASKRGGDRMVVCQSLSSGLRARRGIPLADRRHRPGQDVRARGESLLRGNEALHGVSMDIIENEVISFIGPSGCGKSTFLRCLNS